MFGDDLRRQLGRKYQEESIKTMEAQMKRLYRLIHGSSPGIMYSMDFALVQDIEQVKRALSEIDSWSSKAGIVNTIVQLLPHLWGREAELGGELLEKYETLFSDYKTAHHEGGDALPRGSGEGDAKPKSSMGAIEIIAHRWRRMSDDHFRGFEPSESRLVALYSLIPPQIPSIYSHMRLVRTGSHDRERLEKIMNALVRGGYNVYDVSSGVMMIIHQREKSFVVKFRVPRDLRKFIEDQDDGKSEWILMDGSRKWDSKEISARMRALFPESRLSPRALRQDYETRILPTLTETQREKAMKYANFTS